MAVVYITEHGASIRKRGERFIVEKDGVERLEIEARNLTSIIMLSSVTVTSQALVEMLEHGIEFAIMTGRGKLLGRLTPPTAKNIILRRAQYDKEKDDSFALAQAREIVDAKMENQRQTLLRYALDEPGEQPSLKEAAEEISSFIPMVKNVHGMAELRGIEGAAASSYWKAFGTLFKAEGVVFREREKHPPPDPVNAVLSFGYVLLTNMLQSLLDGLGFEPFLGFFHEEYYGRPSLACDLVEPFRAPVVDRFCVRTFNLKILKPEDFEQSEDGSMHMNEQAIKKFFTAWEKQLHGMKIRQAMREQAEQLRRVFMDKEPLVKPYRWKAR